MAGSASTLPQLFAVEAAKGMAPGAGAAVMRAAYDAAEVPATPDAELRRYRALCDHALGWCQTALRSINLGDYATFLDQGRGWGQDGAAAAEQTIRTTLSILGDEPYASLPDQAVVQAARRTLLETKHALSIASVTEARAERRTLRAGTAAASRAFIAAWPFFGAAPTEARATVGAMRSSLATGH